MLYHTPKLRSKDLAVIELVENAREDLRHQLHVPRRWTRSLRRSTLGRVIRGSNSIEGYRIAKDDVVAAAEGEAVEANASTRAATETYRRAMTHVLGLSQDRTFAWSTGVIKGLHYMMIEYDLDKDPGRWRQGPIFVVDDDRNETVYHGPDHELVPALMDELVARLSGEDTTPVLVRAAMAHLNLAMVHPFRDGNGRMARCLQTLVLGRAGTLEPLFSSIEEWLGNNHRAYYDMLAATGGGSWRPENDASGWVRFCLRAHYQQAQTFLRRTRETETVMAIFEELVTHDGLPGRTAFALWDAGSGFKVRNGTYRTVADVSDQVASRDLKTLVDAGWLEAHGEKRARYYIATKALLDERKRGLERRVIQDPYTGAAVPERDSP
ncbi:MAG: Fic family protein [Gemmatimonadales bacterium]